jgi:translocation and assembly module TamB
MTFSAQTVTLGDTDIYWNGKDLPFSANASNLAILLRETARGRYDGSLASPSILLGGKLKPLHSLALSTQFSFTAKGAKVSSLTWRGRGISGKAAGVLSWDPTLRSQFQFAAFGNVGLLARLCHFTGLESGQIKIEGAADYQTGSLSVQGRARASQLAVRVGTIRPPPVALSFTYAADRHAVKLPNFVLAAVGGQVRGSGEVQLGPRLPRFALSARAEHFNLRSISHILDGLALPLQTMHPVGVLGGEINASWRGDFQNLALAFNLTLKPPASLSAQDLPLEGSIQGEASRSKTTRVILKMVSLKTSYSTILAHGSLGSAQSPLSFRIVTTDFEEWRPLLEFLMQTRLPATLALKQPAIFSGAISGTLGRALLNARLQTGRFETKGWNWSGLGAKIQINHSAFQVSDGRLQRNRSIVSFAGSADLTNWQLMNSSTVRLTLAARDSALGGLMMAAGIHFSLQGTVNGKLNLVGTAEKLMGDGSVQLQKLRLGRTHFPSAMARIQINGDQWKLQRVRLSQGPAIATGAGYFDRSTGAFFLRLRGKKFSLADLAPTEGSANFVLLANGTVEHPNAALSLAITRLAINGGAVGNLKAHVDWNGKSVRGSGLIQGAGGEIHFASMVRTSAPWPLTLSGTYTGFEFAPWIHLISGRSIGASVTGTGAFYLSGPIGNLGQLSGHSEIAKLEIRVPPLTFENYHAVRVSYSTSALHFSPFSMKGPGTDFSVRGSMAFGARPSLALDVSGRADATLVSLLDASLQASGGSQLKVHVGGAPDHPSLQGTMTIRDVSISDAGLPIQLSGVNGTVRLMGDRATISSLQGRIGGGVTSLSGFITLQGVPRYQIRARLRQVRVNYPSDFTSLLDGHLVLAGTAQHGEMTGGVAVRNVFVSPNFNLLALLAESSNRLEVATASSSPSAASRVGLNIRVSSPQGLRLDTRDAHLVADVNLQIRGTLASPVALGDLRARSGAAIFQGNRYNITRGDLTMNNPFHTEPVLDLEAQTRVERYDLTVEVSGPLDRLHIAYRSDPPLPVEDIVSLIALGYTHQPGESGLASTSNRGLSSSVGASALLSQALSSEIGGRIQQLFGVSRIKINPEVNEPGIGTGPRVTVEQQLTPDFTVTYITNTNNSLYRVIRIEWDLSQDVSLIGMRDQNGIIGMELKFRRRFR